MTEAGGESHTQHTSEFQEAWNDAADYVCQSKYLFIHSSLGWCLDFSKFGVFAKYFCVIF